MLGSQSAVCIGWKVNKDELIVTWVASEFRI